MGELPPLWTVEELILATERTIRLPFLSALLGRDCTLRIRKIARIELLSNLPPLPEQASEWKQDEFDRRERAWLATLPHEELDARKRAMRRAKGELVARAALDPQLTVDTAERLGDDLDVVYNHLLAFMAEGGPTDAAQKADAN